MFSIYKVGVGICIRVILVACVPEFHVCNLAAHGTFTYLQLGCIAEHAHSTKKLSNRPKVTHVLNHISMP
jgi:hypothetical protein